MIVLGPVLSVKTELSVWLLSGGLSLSRLGFFRGRVRVPAGGIGPGVPRILAVASPGSNAIDSGETWVLIGCLGRWGRDLGWLNVCLLSFLFLAGGIGPGFRYILDIVSPRANVVAGCGACFVFWVRYECLGVEWGGLSLSGLGIL